MTGTDGDLRLDPGPLETTPFGCDDLCRIRLATRRRYRDGGGPSIDDREQINDQIGARKAPDELVESRSRA